MGTEKTQGQEVCLWQPQCSERRAEQLEGWSPGVVQKTAARGVVSRSCPEDRSWRGGLQELSRRQEPMLSGTGGNWQLIEAAETCRAQTGTGLH